MHRLSAGGGRLYLPCLLLHALRCALVSQVHRSRECLSKAIGERGVCLHLLLLAARIDLRGEANAAAMPAAACSLALHTPPRHCWCHHSAAHPSRSLRRVRPPLAPLLLRGAVAASGLGQEPAWPSWRHRQRAHPSGRAPDLPTAHSPCATFPFSPLSSEELLLRAALVKNLLGPAGAIAHELTLLEESQPSSEPQFGFESQTPQPMQRQPAADPALLQQRLAERQEQAASLERFALQAILRVMLGAEQRLCAAAVSALAAQVDKVCLMYMQGARGTLMLLLVGRGLGQVCQRLPSYLVLGCEAVRCN